MLLLLKAEVLEFYKDAWRVSSKGFGDDDVYRIEKILNFLGTMKRFRASLIKRR